jgi:hypothetical protein
LFSLLYNTIRELGSFLKISASQYPSLPHSHEERFQCQIFPERTHRKIKQFFKLLICRFSAVKIQ